MSKKTPFFSVVIPTYNRAEKIIKAVDSVLNQTCDDYELIIVDDGSNDNTKEVVAKYIFNHKDKRIHYYLQEPSGRPACPRNTGIKIAKGEHIAFLDSDDWWNHEKLELCKKELEKNSFDLLFHDMTIVSNGKTAQVVRCGPVKKPLMQSLFERKYTIPMSGCIVKRTRLLDEGGFSEDFNLVAVEDFDLWLAISKKTDKFGYINRSLTFYLDDSTGISKLGETQIVNFENVYLKHLDDYSKFEKLRKKMMARVYEIMAIRYHRTNNKEKAKVYYTKALNGNRLSYKAYIGYFALLAGCKI